jgi:hypothetical protein
MLVDTDRDDSVDPHKSLVSYGRESASALYRRIDELDSSTREREKIPVLSSDPDYLAFLRVLTDQTEENLALYFDELYADTKFFTDFESRLAMIDDLANVGDLRFHAVTIYIVARSLRPHVVIETGVAHGKSSAYILLALDHNDHGHLYSVDLPATGLNAPDGSQTSLSGLEPGWLVLDRLRKRWTLTMADSLSFLRTTFPALLAGRDPVPGVSLFLHDSLHTFEHVAEELRLVSPFLARPAIVCVDNVDMPGGLAFEEYLINQALPGASYTDFAGSFIH